LRGPAAQELNHVTANLVLGIARERLAVRELVERHWLPDADIDVERA
jgi:hypothetical protein